MSIERAFAPYEGDKPYLFVSYAHADWDRVRPVIETLHERGWRIWYDEGIEVGSEWPECIAQHLADSSLVLAFLSQSYTRSDNCRREMHYALTKRIRTINIFLEQTALSPGMELQVGNSFALMKYEMSEELFYEKLWSAPPLLQSGASGEAPDTVHKRKKTKAPRRVKTAKPGKKRRVRRAVWLTLLLLMLASAITLAIVGHFTGLTERVQIRLSQPVVTALPGSTEAAFTSELFERAARMWIGEEEGRITVAQLAGVTELWLCGDEVYFSEPEQPVEGEGTLSSLTDLRYFTGLRKLVLIGQPLLSLETLPPARLETLSVLDGSLASLRGVGNLPKLRELITDGCPVTDPGDLGRCLELRRLSLRGGYVSDYSSLRPLIHLTEVSLSNGNLDSINVILKKGRLTALTLQNCDLQGFFFREFDSERRVVRLTLIDCSLNSTANLEDFTGLTELTLLGGGGDLDWSLLAELPALRQVTVDAQTREAVESALAGTDVIVTQIGD